MPYPDGTEALGEIPISAQFFDKGGAVYNIQHPDFGAVGDGVEDDTEAIQAAIDAAPDFGGVVYIPEGSFLITEPLVVASRNRLAIVGQGNIVIGGDNDFIAFDWDDCIRCQMEGFRIIGGGASDDTSTGIHLDDCFHIDIVRLNIRDVQTGVYWTESGSTAHELYLFNNVIRSTDITSSVGVYIDSDDNVLSHNIIRGYDVGIRVAASANFQRIHENHIYRSPSAAHTYDIDLIGATGSIVSSNYIDGEPSGAFINIHAGGNRGLSIIGNTFLTNDADQVIVHFNATVGSTNIFDIAFIGNTIHASGVTLTDPITFGGNVITSGAKRVYFEHNSWRGSTVVMRTTKTTRTATIDNGQTSETIDFSDVLIGDVAYAIVTGGHAEVKDAYVSSISGQNVTITVGSATSDDRTVYVTAVSELARDL